MQLLITSFLSCFSCFFFTLAIASLHSSADLDGRGLVEGSESSSLLHRDYDVSDRYFFPRGYGNLQASTGIISVRGLTDEKGRERSVFNRQEIKARLKELAKLDHQLKMSIVEINRAMKSQKELAKFSREEIRAMKQLSYSTAKETTNIAYSKTITDMRATGKGKAADDIQKALDTTNETSKEHDATFKLFFKKQRDYIRKGGEHYNEMERAPPGSKRPGPDTKGQAEKKGEQTGEKSEPPPPQARRQHKKADKNK